MFANHNNLYLLSLVCILALFIASLLHLRRRDKKAWKTLILLSGALLAGVLIAARFVAGGEFSPTLFAPGLGVTAAALLGLLVATLFGPQKPKLAAPGELSANSDTADPERFDTAERVDQSDIGDTVQTIAPDYHDPLRPDHQTLGAVAAGNVSLIEINADLEAASNDGGVEHFSDIDESVISSFAETDVPQSQGSRDELRHQSPKTTEQDTRWKAPVTSLHERRSPEKSTSIATASNNDDLRHRAQA